MLHITFYGDFSALEQNTLKSFLASLSAASHSPPKSLRLSLKSVLEPPSGALFSPTVAKWWSLTRGYTDLEGKGVSQTVIIKHETFDDYSLGKVLSHSDISSLAIGSARAASSAEDDGGMMARSIHVILTAADVAVEGFCMHSCGQHSYTTAASEGGRVGKVAYAWVGNAKEQCPGYCAWPFARAEYGPQGGEPPLKAPNEVGVDGMIINLAKVLVGAATNPYGDAYYQGEASYGVEAGGACTGAFGEGAYPGYPGHVLREADTSASYNAEGLKGGKFLVPWIWNPATLACAGQP